MSHLRRLSYSASLGVIITGALILLTDFGHLFFVFLLLPGMLAEFILTTLIPLGDRENYSYTHRAWAANVVFYSFTLYATSMIFHWLQAEAKLSGTSVIRRALGIKAKL